MTCFLQHFEDFEVDLWVLRRLTGMSATEELCDFTLNLQRLTTVEQDLIRVALLADLTLALLVALVHRGEKFGCRGVRALWQL